MDVIDGTRPGAMVDAGENAVGVKRGPEKPANPAIEHSIEQVRGVSEAQDSLRVEELGRDIVDLIKQLSQTTPENEDGLSSIVTMLKHDRMRVQDWCVANVNDNWPGATEALLRIMEGLEERLRTIQAALDRGLPLTDLPIYEKPGRRWRNDPLALVAYGNNLRTRWSL
jgi:hypothetical protein